MTLRRVTRLFWNVRTPRSCRVTYGVIPVVVRFPRRARCRRREVGLLVRVRRLFPLRCRLLLSRGGRALFRCRRGVTSRLITRRRSSMLLGRVPRVLVIFLSTRVRTSRRLGLRRFLLVILMVRTLLLTRLLFMVWYRGRRLLVPRRFRRQYRLQFLSWCRLPAGRA